ncbi:hypothetical protein QJ48_04215 [Paenibacillus sp. A3]|uniref:hypothetical protein n=1 Tax=Paenibacillus sp. A3 TaxID=1337054 RepID=UPI0006E6C520|nr:hypothetical protein [Paenibacillus sp. A3]KPV60736.1 hypothetical protein QJ48_04215 [Paenibacillus sp. A3]
MKNWSKPVDVSDVQLAFGGDMKKLLPPMSDIPREFQDGHTKWNDLVGKWFLRGLNKLNVTPRAGVDGKKALRHIKAILGSWEPKHEHKEAGCAYLMSLFFEDEFTFEVAEREV